MKTQKFTIDDEVIKWMAPDDARFPQEAIDYFNGNLWTDFEFTANEIRRIYNPFDNYEKLTVLAFRFMDVDPTRLWDYQYEVWHRLLRKDTEDEFTFVTICVKKDGEQLSFDMDAPFTDEEKLMIKSAVCEFEKRYVFRD